MNEVITIENTEMQIREYNGQRVVTFKDIDTVHENKSGTARRNFNRNKKHFIEGEDYFSLTKKNSNETNSYIRNITVPNKGITLLTESGYLMIVKSLNGDIAWKVQRQLVNSYFKVKQEIPERKTYPLLVEDKWLAEMEPNFEYLCKQYKLTRKGLYHKILLDIGKSYNVDDYKILYKYEKGYKSRFVMEVVSYFAELREEAEKTILEHVARKKNKK
mgnify:FL=1|jgi:hypothetical protein|nr:MAG TPA: hypothetical protein [Caudoviricetes sp.]